MTALHFAAHSGPDRSEIARLLLRHGADPTLRDAHGRTPLDSAADYNPGVAKVLRRA